MPELGVPYFGPKWPKTVSDSTLPRIGPIVAEPGGGPPEGASIATPLDETEKIMRETLDPFFSQKGPKSVC